jgi:hypothetical protein
VDCSFLIALRFSLIFIFIFTFKNGLCHFISTCTYIWSRVYLVSLITQYWVSHSGIFKWATHLLDRVTGPFTPKINEGV